MIQNNKSKIQIGPIKLETISLGIIALVVYLSLLFPTFQVFPEYSKSIYGNETIPPYFKGILFFAPIGMWLIIGFTIVSYVILNMISEYRKSNR